MSKSNVEMWANDTISGVPRKDVAWPALIADAKTMFDNATTFFDEVDGVTFKYAEYANNVLLPTHDEVFLGKITPAEFATKMQELTKQYWETKGTGAPAATEEAAVEEGGEAAAAPTLDKTATLEFWSMWNENEPQAAVLKKYAEGFEKETGIKVNITFNGRENQTLVRTALGAGTAVDLMDQDGAPLAGGLMTEGQGYALDEMLSQEAWGETGTAFKDVFIPGMLEQFQLEGKTYLVPHTLITYAIWHDKRIMEEAGITAPPATWDEFLAALEKIKATGVAPIAQDAGVNFYNVIWYFYLVERMKGPGFLLAAAEDKTGEKWNDPAFAKAAEMERELWDKGYVVEGAEGFTWPQGQQTMADGLSAMELCGSWLPNELSKAVDPEFQWGGWPFPAVADGAGKNTDIPVVMLDYMVLKDSKYPQEAFAFIRYAMSKSNVEMWANDTISGVPRKDVEWPALIADAKTMFDNATTFFDEVDGVTFKYAEYANNVLMPTHDEVFLGKITPAEFATKMQELTKQYWETKK
nr:MAG: extracellular solute-binding protein [Dehalococcoidia bacterium]